MTVRASPVPPALRTLGNDVATWLQNVANRSAAPQTDSVAATAADLRTDFNALLAKLRAAGLLQE